MALGAKELLNRYLAKFWNRRMPVISFQQILLVFASLALVWAAGKLFESRILLVGGASLMAILNIASLVLIITIPWPLLVSFAGNTLKRRKKEPVAVDHGRRKFIKVAAGVLPVMALGTAGSGMAGSFQAVKVSHVPMYFEKLPDDLDGFRILHLSDLHLGYYFHLSDLEDTLRHAQHYKPDLVLVTGDVADDLNQLPDALDLISQLRSVHGAFMSLGNHEYIRGIERVYNIVSKSHVPLLVNNGHRITHKNSHIYLGGADDPKRLRANVDPFLERTTREAMKNAADNDFRLLMSHRPKVLDVAGRYRIDLILSGHTHGGQILFGGKSLFEGMVDREPYLWGRYKKDQTQLYTSAGMGHWFPFRLNCPPEAPLISIRNKYQKRNNLVSTVV